MEPIKKNITALARWCKKHLVGILVLATVALIMFASTVLFSWLVGFWLNGLYGFKFELASCWSGLGAVVTGIGSILTIAGLNLGKSYIDSKFNSPLGKKPKRGGDENSKGNAE